MGERGRSSQATTLDVLPPLGHFGLALDAAHRKHYAAFAAGSGITPLLSIIKTTLATEPKSQFTLFYGNRASSTVMFKEELAALKDVYLTRFNLVHVLSREAQDIELLHGRIDGAKAEALMAHWLDLDEVDAVFVCGPDGMMQAVAEALKARGYPDTRVRIERFATSVPRHEHRSSKPVEPGRAECEVTVVLEGVTRNFTLEKGKENIPRGRAQSRRRAAVLVQERRLLDVSREADRGRGRHGRQLRARGLRARARLRADVPELPRDRSGVGGLRSDCLSGFSTAIAPPEAATSSALTGSSRFP
jgi:ferredoxin-NADP reductase